MSDVTEDIVSNLIKSNLTQLKSFAELINAEFTEEGHEEGTRDKYKDDISRILEKFGTCEAEFQKTLVSLNRTKNELANEVVVEEECNPERLLKDVDEIINLFEGRSRPINDEPVFENFNEERIVDVLVKVEDVLNEFHPLKFRDDDDQEDDPNEEEENRMSKVLDKFEKKYMQKHEKSMTVDDDDNDNENTMEVDVGESESSSEDEETRVDASQRPSTSNEKEKKKMDSKLKQMWKTYDEKTNQFGIKDLKQIYEEKLNQVEDIPFDHLAHFSKFNRSILELFSTEAIVVLRDKPNYVDPISKMPIQNPVRNNKCGHVYDKECIYNVLRRKKDMRCPFLGCSIQTFSVNDLEEDEDLTQKVAQSLTLKASTSLNSTSGNISNAEYLDSDNESD